MSRRCLSAVIAAVMTALTALAAEAQSLGTLRWQLQPFCNVVTLNVNQQGSVYTLDGYDDQCGAAQRAPLVGLATPNPDGSIGFGLSVVTVPGGRGVQIEARITLAGLSGPWADSAGNSGTFAFGAATGGSPRPLPSSQAAIPGAFSLLDDGGFLARGTDSYAGIPAEGPGKRMMWHQGKAAFRAGFVGGTQWDDASVGSGSTATGISTRASGNFSTALGGFTTASADSSTAMGNSTTASGASSTAMGSGTTASAFASTALGWSTAASGAHSTATGNSTTASGANSFAIGASTRASGTNSTAMGASTTASGTDSTALGDFTTATGSDSTAMGIRTTASGSASTAMGNLTTASGESSTAMGAITTAAGRYSSAMGFQSTASGDNSTAIGTSLSAAGGASVVMGVRAATTTTGNGSFVYGDQSTGQSGSVVTSISPNQFLVRASGGAVFWSTPDTVYPTSPGVILFHNTSAWSSLSDVNSKENFGDVADEEVLSRIARMPVRQWNYKAQGAAIRHMGPTAQDFHAAFGLGEDPRRISTIDADGVALAGVRALESRTRELRGEGSALRAQVEALTRENDDLRARLARLEALLERR
jgi:hypothetical protein